MTTLSHQLRKYLLNVEDRVWQQIRAQVRWRYAKENWIPPRRLVRFMDFLPEHPQTWADYADEITQARKWKRSAALTTRDKVKHQRSQRRRRDYQRNYMRDYRARLRSGSL